MKKTQICITVDNEAYAEAKLKGINLSKTLNDYLCHYLEIKEPTSNEEELSIEIQKKQAELGKLQAQKHKIDEKRKRERGKIKWIN